MPFLIGIAAAFLLAAGVAVDTASAAVPAPSWSDEFDGAPGAPPNPATWRLRTGGRWRYGGRLELQCYTRRPENVSQDGLGHLAITARYEPGNTFCADGPNDYTSARLDTRGLRTFRYGRIAARIKLPTAAGSWPAWWTAGAVGVWPTSGEMELLEHRPGLDPDEAHQAIVGATADGAWWAQRTEVSGIGDGAWHTYGVDWRPGRLTFLIDGRPTWTRTTADLRDGWLWPFDAAFGLILNLAVGNWAGAPDPAQYPATMLVDWVRVHAPDPVVAVAGDVAAPNGGSARTAALLADLGMDTVLVAGDGAYPDGTAADYARYYEPTWGTFKAITHPAPGNHDYHVPDAGGYFDYFGARAGERAKGWYSLDVGSWHVIALNTSNACSPVPCGAGSEQYEWLKADLAAHDNRCTLAFWHHPRWSAGAYAPGTRAVAPLWNLLYDDGAELVFSGHDHTYQRFAPLDKTGTADPGRGLRSFVVGTGGNGAYAVSPPGGNLEASQSGTLGVLAVTLHENGYDWRFIPEAGKTYTDAGSDVCH